MGRLTKKAARQPNPVISTAPNDGPVATASAPIPPHMATTWAPPVRGEGREQQSEGRRQQGGRPRPLDQSARHQQGNRRRQAGKRRTQAEDGESGEEHPPAPEAVGGASGDHQERAEDDASTR